MARLAGMNLHERWSDWTRAPFDSDSRQHVSVWEKPAPQVRAGSGESSTTGYRHR
jgi:hypothetical protein